MSSQTESRPNDFPEDSSERAPLLDTQARSESGAVLIVDSEAPPDPSLIKVDKKEVRWGLIWKIILWTLAAVLAVVLVTGFIKGGDTEFNWGETFKKALGGGLSGAAGMSGLPLHMSIIINLIDSNGPSSSHFNGMFYLRKEL